MKASSLMLRDEVKPTRALLLAEIQ